MRSSYTAEFNFSKYLENVVDTDTIKYTGKVVGVKGLQITSEGPRSIIGEMCTIMLRDGTKLLAEVVGFEGNIVKLTAYGDTKGIEVGCEVVGSGDVLQVPVGMNLLGRVIDATGHSCDGLGEIVPEKYYPAIQKAPDAMSKPVINKRIQTGVRAIDGLLTVGKGQRVGIFAGSGIGKSTLMSMIARNTNADINVIGLIGERGREVREFIENDLGKEGLQRSVVVVATGDTPSICRLRAAYVCTAVAEYFRDQGKDVVMMMDSVTRFAHAQREIGLANGEPPAQNGYPPSVFDLLPKLLERTGTNDKGTITAFYTVLVDGDDYTEPVTDKVRGTLDGHIVLTRKLSDAGHYPPIDILASISRLTKYVSGPVTRKAIDQIRSLMAAYADKETMITAGIYEKGRNAAIDRAIDMHDPIDEFLKQDMYEKCTIEQTLDKLSELLGIEIPQEEYSEQPMLTASENEAAPVSSEDTNIES